MRPATLPLRANFGQALAWAANPRHSHAMADLEFAFRAEHLVATPAGALWWGTQRTLVVADLHFEKGSAFAARGVPLPPYDTAVTLDDLARLIDRWRPQRVIALGDSFHDRRAGERITPAAVQRLRTLTARVDWVWITGNHDPHPSGPWGGSVVECVSERGLTFCHEARGMAGEVSGHWHPKARVKVRGALVTRRCFVLTPGQLILPAFGALTGGLDVFDRALSPLIGRGFEVLMCGRATVTRLPAERLSPRVEGEFDLDRRTGEPRVEGDARPVDAEDLGQFRLW